MKKLLLGIAAAFALAGAAQAQIVSNPPGIVYQDTVNNNIWGGLHALDAPTPGTVISTTILGPYACQYAGQVIPGGSNPTTQSSTCYGYNAGQYINGGGSFTITGAFAARGARAYYGPSGTNLTNSASVSAFPFLQGGSDTVTGEAADLWGAGSLNGLTATGFNACFQTLDATNLTCTGIGAGLSALHDVNVTDTGSTSGEFAQGNYNTFTGSGAGFGNASFIYYGYPNTGLTTSTTGNTHTSILVDGVASTAGLVVGQTVAGTGIPGGDTIATIINGTSFNLANAATATANGVALTINGAPTGSVTFSLSHADAVTASGLLTGLGANQVLGIYSPSVTGAFETITAVTATTVTTSNITTNTPIVPVNNVLVDTTAGKSYVVVAGVAAGSNQWIFSDTTGMTVGDTVTNAAITGGTATILRLFRTFAVLSAVNATNVTAGSLLCDLTLANTTANASVTPCFSPSTAAPLGSAVWTFPAATITNAPLLVGDVVYTPGTAWSATEVTSVDTTGNTITVSEPSYATVGQYAGLYLIPNPLIGTGNSVHGQGGFGMISGNASNNVSAGIGACSNIAYTGNRNICIGPNTTLPSIGANDTMVIGGATPTLTTTGLNNSASAVTTIAGTTTANIYTSFALLTAASANWTVPATVNQVEVCGVGAGGGGGGVSTAASSAAGGFGGDFMCAFYQVTPGGTVAYTNSTTGGAGGAAGANGANGGNATFGTLTFGGGYRGTGSVSGNAAGGSNSNLNGTRFPVTPSAAVTVFSEIDYSAGPGFAGFSGAGGATPWGQGAAAATNAAGVNAGATAYGAGGSGANTNATSSFAGGNGAPSAIVVRW